METVARGRVWAGAALMWAAAYGGVRVYWALGGRTGYTVCPPDATAFGGGCGAARVRELPFPGGWGAALLCLAALVIAAGITRHGPWSQRRARRRRAGRPVRGWRAAGWAVCGVLVVAAFPAHLVVQLVGLGFGMASDPLDLANRAALLAGGVAFAGAAAASARCGHAPAARTGAGVVEMPRWVRWWAYATVWVAFVGFTLPHWLWGWGVAYGTTAAAERTYASMPLEMTVGGLLPVAGGLLTLGLVRPWAQLVPAWAPVLGGRRVPRAVAAGPPAVIGLAMAAYGPLSLAVVVRGLASGAVTWASVLNRWGELSVLAGFSAWGVTLLVTAYGFLRVTGHRCALCDPHRTVATKDPAARRRRWTARAW